MAAVTDPRNARKTARATRPAGGSCRWAVQPTSGLNGHPGCLIIANGNGEEAYLVTENADGRLLLGWQLRKADGTTYDLPADLSGCDCPDHTYHPERPGGCKHIQALRAALARL